MSEISIFVDPFTQEHFAQFTSTGEPEESLQECIGTELINKQERKFRKMKLCDLIYYVVSRN